MLSIKTLVDEVARATGLGKNAQAFLGVVADFIFKQPGGIAGFRDKFKNAGLGDIFDSWLSGQPNMRTIDAGQIRSALGPEAVQEIADKSGSSSTMVPTLLATAVPMLMRAITAGGVMPTSLPASLSGLMGGGKTGTKRPFRLWRWVLPILALLALAYCGWTMRNKTTLPPRTTESTTTPATPTAGTAVASAEPRFSFKNDGGKIAVAGTLATAAEKFALLEGLGTTFGRNNVSGQIDVDAKVSPAGWLDKLKGMLPSLKANGLKFAFTGDKVNLDSSALPDAERASISSLFQQQLGNVEVQGGFDRGVEAINKLKGGYTATDLTAALNLTTVNFETGSATLTRSSEAVIGKAAEAIEGAPSGTKVEVGGHTDRQGDAVSNQALSEQRAQAVVAALVAHGVPADRMVARGFGSNRPLADNGTEAGRAKNRRIEYTVR
jgi:OOP family OmpA-OmpF porin